jgi:hypothetical protein
MSRLWVEYDFKWEAIFISRDDAGMLRGLADLRNEKRSRMGWSRTPMVSIFRQKGLPLSFEGHFYF